MAQVEFRLLGPLEVRRDGCLIPVAAGKQRVLLAALLFSAGRVVPVDELIEVLWEERPPWSAQASLHNYVKRLRQALGDADRREISTHPHGYQISVEPRGLDVTEFDALLCAARAAARQGSWPAAAGKARTALELWRGEPLADVGSPALALRELPRLAEMRLQALEARVEADLHLGRQAEVIGELPRIVAGHPLRERLHGLLMLALYRDGRQAEALAAYQHARSVLIGELGAEPGPGLRELHQRILAADPVLALVPPGPVRATLGDEPGAAVPRELPGVARHFTGRIAELAALTRLLEQDGEQEPEAAIIVISGTAGVGKTTLAVRWARQAASRFPDGQLYVNLRGYDPEQPARPPAALAGFLRALGVAGPDIPAETDERAARYRSLLAGRRMLVLLDNASDVEQVRPLLPGAPGCAVMVTSRDHMSGLVARDGARRLDLDLLTAADAADLLTALIGGRAAADPAATAALSAACSRLPLALRLAAELAATRPAVALADLAGELADVHRRLDLLDAGGDRRTAVRAVFSWSYRHLDPAGARAFRLTGLHPGADYDVHAVAALTGGTVTAACRTLDALSRAHLMHAIGHDRYGLHDLLRAYARGLADEEDGPDESRAALTRLFDHYLSTAAAAMDTLHPAEKHRRPQVPPPAAPGPPVSGAETARDWLDTERATLIAVAAHAADHGWPRHATGLAATLYRYFDSGGHFPEAVAICGHALRAARQTDDLAAEAGALTSLGSFDRRQGRYRQAASHLRQALTLYRQIGDRTGQARALHNLGDVIFQQGPYEQAVSHQREALTLYRETGDRTGEARALASLAGCAFRQGRHGQAAGYLRQTLALSRETGDRTSEADALGNLGEVSLRQGSYQQAARYYRQALVIYRQTGNPEGEAGTLAGLGDADLRQGHHAQASDHLSHALAIFRRTGDPTGEALVLNSLGEVLLATGQPGQARRQHAAALALASQIGERYEQARAYDGLGRSHHAAGDPGQARGHWRHALSLYSELGAPEAAGVRTKLASADDPGHNER